MRETRRTERAIVDAILRDLKARGVWVTKTYGSQLRRGLPDLICCVRGRFVGLEVKRPGRTATPLQEEELRRITSAGGTARVVFSVADVAEIVADTTTHSSSLI